jgi:UDP-N-acetyl-2-amino-2-deoxyglucuronate dehydrogenase
MLLWIFGEVEENIVHLYDERRASGFLKLKKANVRWFLSLDKKDLPKNVDKSTYRSITIDGKEVEFSEGFTDLHTLSYKEILDGKGYGLDDSKPSIQVVSDIRNKVVIGMKGDYHPILLNIH